jgi:FtsH-binding integral membrane protein
MNQNYWDGNAAVMTGGAESLQRFLTQVYTWMALGLALTGFTAIATASSETLIGLIFGTPLFFILVVGELALVFFFSRAVAKGASMTAIMTMFAAYSALNGVTLSAVLLAYTGASVARVFFITAGTFGGLSLFGYVTKKDLSAAGRFAFMGLWGVILIGIVNVFLRSTRLDLVMSVVGLGIFTVLTAYDTQKLTRLHAAYAGDEGATQRLAMQGALQLYLDFINLFLFLLRLFGNRRR